MSETVIEVESLHKRYGKFNAVDGISFTVNRGEVFAFLGPNGAGKTTTTEILECLKTPTGGSVSVLGHDVRRDEMNIKEKIGVLPQSFNAYDWLTVRENIDYFANMYSKHVDIDEAIRMLDLSDKRNTLFKDLSGGLKQRVGIAISLINDPEVVFLDEPTTGLDPKARRDVWEAIRSLKSRGKTVFLTTHYMDEAYYLADKIDIIHKGKIIAEGTPDELIDAYGGKNTLVIKNFENNAAMALRDDIEGSRLLGNDVIVEIEETNFVERISKAMSAINDRKIPCKELFIKRSTLEDVFLNLTGEKLTQEAV